MIGINKQLKHPTAKQKYKSTCTRGSYSLLCIFGLLTYNSLILSYSFFKEVLISTRPALSVVPSRIRMTDSLGAVAQLLEASLDPRQNKQGKFSSSRSTDHH
jgi:hypothetical protein